MQTRHPSPTDSLLAHATGAGIPRQSDAVRLVATVRHELGIVLARAEQRGIVLPTAYVVRTADFLGLAFARELSSDRRNVAQLGDDSQLRIGCKSRDQVACALLGVDRDAARRLLEMSVDPEYERRLVIVDRVCRVAALACDSLVMRELPARRQVA